MYESNVTQNWASLVQLSLEYFRHQQDKLHDEYPPEEFDDVRWSQNNCKLAFFKNGVKAAKANIQLIGSIKLDVGNWVWSWANPTVMSMACKEIKRVKMYGEDRNLSTLCREEFEANSEEGRLMAAVALYLLKAKGVYIDKKDNEIVFLLIQDISAVLTKNSK